MEPKHCPVDYVFDFFFTIIYHLSLFYSFRFLCITSHSVDLYLFSKILLFFLFAFSTHYKKTYEKGGSKLSALVRISRVTIPYILKKFYFYYIEKLKKVLTLVSVSLGMWNLNFQGKTPSICIVQTIKIKKVWFFNLKKKKTLNFKKPSSLSTILKYFWIFFIVWKL